MRAINSFSISIAATRPGHRHRRQTDCCRRSPSCSSKLSASKSKRSQPDRKHVMPPKITPDHLGRGAVVYIRQSTPGQVAEHTESQRRQYALVEAARTVGFASITVIDDDLGRSGSGLVERPGFEKLVALVCSGSAGAVFCLEASRLARNGRDWHHLIDLCALVGALVIDPDGTYDPRLVNDRLLLGLKGTMSEYELSLLRQRGMRRRCEASCSSVFHQVIAGTRSGRSRWTLTSASAASSDCCSTSSRSSAALGRSCSGHRIRRCNYQSSDAITAARAKSNGARRPTIQCCRSSGIRSMPAPMSSAAQPSALASSTDAPARPLATRSR